MLKSKIKVIFVYTNLGIGGIAKSLVTILNLIDYSKYDVTLYIRRDDVLDLINEVPPQVNTILIKNEVKARIFERNIKGYLFKIIYKLLEKRHKHLAKQLFIKYKYPIQRKKEYTELNNQGEEWDVAISYSTDEDDPVFVNKYINASKKYIFVHQSTKIANENVNAMKKYDGIISDNPILVSWIETMINNKTKVIPIEIHVDFQRIKKMANEQTDGIIKNGLVISTCGRLCLTKGYDYVVQIANQLKKQGLAFTWYWIGDGPDRKDMEDRIAHCDLKNELILVGNQLNPYPYINACDIYVQPSRAEAYPLTILETLILKKLVISTRTVGGKYILGKHGCGILVDNPVEELPDIIMDLSKKPDRIKLEQEKTQAINWEEDKQRYLDQLDRLLEGTIENIN